MRYTQSSSKHVVISCHLGVRPKQCLLRHFVILVAVESPRVQTMPRACQEWLAVVPPNSGLTQLHCLWRIRGADRVLEPIQNVLVCFPIQYGGWQYPKRRSRTDERGLQRGALERFPTLSLRASRGPSPTRHKGGRCRSIIISRPAKQFCKATKAEKTYRTYFLYSIYP